MNLTVVLDKPHQEVKLYKQRLDITDFYDADLVTIELGEALTNARIMVPIVPLVHALRKLELI